MCSNITCIGSTTFSTNTVDSGLTCSSCSASGWSVCIYPAKSPCDNIYIYPHHFPLYQTSLSLHQVHRQLTYSDLKCQFCMEKMARGMVMMMILLVCLGNIYPGAPSQLGGSGKWVITVSGRPPQPPFPHPSHPPPQPLFLCGSAV